MLSNKVRRSRSFFNLQSSLELSPKILSSIEFCHPRIDNESEECYSTENDSYELFQDTFPKEESEDILLNIYKNQNKIVDYSEDDNIAFSSRESVLEWANQILNALDISTREKESIFFRFASCFDTVMEKLYLLKKSIFSILELKKVLLTIFLISYKLEGLSLGSISISNFIDVFFQKMDIDKSEMEKTIQQSELRILSLIDYNVFCIDNNINEISLILLDLLKRKFSLSEDLIELINMYIAEANLNIVKSEDILFDLLPIDKALISLCSVIIYLKSYLSNVYDKESTSYKLLFSEIDSLPFESFKYSKNELKVIKLQNWTQIKKECLIYAKELHN